MKLSVELPDEQASRLRDSAQRLGLEPRELANALLLDQLGDSDQAFDEAAERVLEKNAELYRRLS